MHASYQKWLSFLRKFNNEACGKLYVRALFEQHWKDAKTMINQKIYDIVIILCLIWKKKNEMTWFETIKLLNFAIY